ncbi:MAG: helix-turn-helix transcriptional regulator [Deinococcota bacterium]|jgi:hypothetical protein|nr:helix-turn-helix transcriptional regulator [Deinococcota bacterium]
MMTKWKLKEFLDAHGVTAYALSQKVKGEVSRNSIYNMLKERPRGVYLATLDAIIPALRELTGKPVGVADLFEVDEGLNRSGERSPSYLALAGMIDDQESPGNVSTHHDAYLGEALEEKHLRAAKDKR